MEKQRYGDEEICMALSATLILSSNHTLVTRMAEYNRETGLLTLTLNEALSFHSTTDRMPETAPPMEFYAEKLREFGYEVIRVSADKLEVKATENEIFELLSGQHIYL